MTRTLRRLPILLLPAAVLACGGSTQPAATVDGTVITQESVVDELEAIRANSDYVDAIEAAGGTPVFGEGEDTFDAGFVASQLAVQIQYALVGNEVAQRELDTEGECTTAARQNLIGQLGQLVGTGDGEPVLDAFPEEYQDYLVGRDADVLALQGDLVGRGCVDDDAIEAYYEEHRDEFQQACAVHILVATPEEAADVVAALRGGADFATVAAERSTDAGSAAQGGQLPCVSPGEFVPEFEAALFGQPLGVVGDPVQSDFGYHVIRVDSRDTAPLDDVRDQVAQALAQDVQVSFADWFRQALADADVEVDDRYGEWNAERAEIQRDSDRATTSTTAVPPPSG